jgi:hypothetical protein
MTFPDRRMASPKLFELRDLREVRAWLRF